MNINVESPEERLLERVYKIGEKSLFILEGVLVYLDEEAVSITFNMMKKS